MSDWTLGDLLRFLWDGTRPASKPATKTLAPAKRTASAQLSSAGARVGARRLLGFGQRLTPRAFISFDFDHDSQARTLFTGQSRNSATPFEIHDWSSKKALAQARWERLVEAKISKCYLMIVLVGQHMTSASGVAKEIVMARRHHVPYFGVYVSGAGPRSPLPAGLARARVYLWTWPNVTRGIDRMLGEGKNLENR